MWIIYSGINKKVIYVLKKLKIYKIKKSKCLIYFGGGKLNEKSINFMILPLLALSLASCGETPTSKVDPTTVESCTMLDETDIYNDYYQGWCIFEIVATWTFTVGASNAETYASLITAIFGENTNFEWDDYYGCWSGYAASMNTIEFYISVSENNLLLGVQVYNWAE